MRTRSAPCDSIDLALLLDGDESSDAFRSAASHVDGCAECQQRLTELSGDLAYWVTQREMLQPIEGDLPETGFFSRYHSAESSHLRRTAVDEAAIREMLGAPSHPETLGRLGRYEIERVIGTGGMGIVLKGFDSELNRPVAIKLLAPHLARVGAARQRFAREARAAAAVVHEHVVPIHNVESDNAQPFLVMQFIPGESLQTRVEREGPLSVPEILRIAVQGAAGLAAAHAQGLVHRDVKPANILLENGVERVYLTDFGLARASDDASLTYTGVLAGTPHYMSPEQADGQPVDHRSDLFSLGSVIYFMATGHPPFRANGPMAVLKRTCHDAHRPAWHSNAEIPDELSAIIDRLLEKDPSRRFANAVELRQELERVLIAVQQGKLGRMRRGTRALRTRRLVTGLILISIAVMIVLSGWLKNEPQQAERGATSHESPNEEAPDGTAIPAESPLAKLLSVDPSPGVESQAELDVLFHMLDVLELSPFPESRDVADDHRFVPADSASRE